MRGCMPLYSMSSSTVWPLRMRSWISRGDKTTRGSSRTGFGAVGIFFGAPPAVAELPVVSLPSAASPLAVVASAVLSLVELPSVEPLSAVALSPELPLAVAVAALDPSASDAESAAAGEPAASASSKCSTRKVRRFSSRGSVKRSPSCRSCSVVSAGTRISESVTSPSRTGFSSLMREPPCWSTL